MKFLKVLGIVAMTFLGSHSFAGAGAHGGQGVVCRDPSKTIKSLQALDHYEGETLTGIPLEMGAPLLSYEEKIRYVLNRLATLDPIAAARYQERADAFFADLKLPPNERKLIGFLTPAQMKLINDSNEPINPDEGCYKEQFVMQFVTPMAGYHRYEINKELWSYAISKGNTDALAGIVLHEIIYTDAVLFFGQSDSDGTRRYNFKISSNAMNSMTISDYARLVSESGFAYNGFSMFSVPYRGLLLRILPGGSFLVSCGVFKDENGVCGQVARPTEILVNGGQKLTIGTSDSGSVFWGNHPLENHSTVMWDSTGNLGAAFADYDQTLTIGGTKVVAAGGGIIYFYRSQERNVWKLHLAATDGESGQILNTPIGPVKFFAAVHGKPDESGVAEFDESGRLVTGYIKAQTIKMGNFSYDLHVTEIRFWKDGDIGLDPIPDGDNLWFLLNGLKSTFYYISSLHNNGVPAKGKVTKGTFIDVNGKRVTVKHSEVILDSQGKLISKGS